jgi:hypothetical protein
MSDKKGNNENVLEDESKEQNERSRPTRKITYERKLKTTIPEEITEMFLEKGLHVQYQPYRLANIVQHSALAELVRDGWEFVTSKDLPEWFADYFDKEDFRGRSEVLVAHDLVLMQADVRLVESRDEYFRQLARAELKPKSQCRNRDLEINL